MIDFILAGIVANGTEWVAHKYLLHNLGKKKDSFFHYHWRHHHTCRKNDNADAIYKNWRTEPDVWKEAGTLAVISLLNMPMWWVVSPEFYLGLLFFTCVYFAMHAYSHTNVEWGKRWMPHHYDHHMGKNQDLNWCVTFPLWDWVLGTRQQYFHNKNT